MYDGVQQIEYQLGKEGLFGLANSNLIPLAGFIQLRNATLEDHSVRTGAGAALVGSAFDAVRTGLFAIDFWPTVSLQRTVVADDTGPVW